MPFCDLSYCEQLLILRIGHAVVAPVLDSSTQDREKKSWVFPHIIQVTSATIAQHPKYRHWQQVPSIHRPTGGTDSHLCRSQGGPCLKSLPGLAGSPEPSGREAPEKC